MRLPRALAPSIGYAVLAAADTWLAGASDARAHQARLLTKPLLMPVLHLAFRRALPAREQATMRLRRGTEVGQGLSWVGDVALLGPGSKAFLAGVGGFAGAHLGYVAAFVSARGDSRPSQRLPLALWLCLTPVMAGAARRHEPELAVPVAGYATLLSAMLAASRVLDPSLPRRGRRLVRSGAALFVLSDTVLATQKFLLDAQNPAAERLVMASYSTAQGLIALGVAQISSPGRRSVGRRRARLPRAR